MAVTASTLRVSPAIAAVQHPQRGVRAVAVVRGGCASSSGAPVASASLTAKRGMMAGSAAAYLARESRTMLALRAPAQRRTSVVRVEPSSRRSARWTTLLYEY
ncbi:hypothetical protein N8152_00860 [bacterium]|nr:hypothetical protein [bacterium]